MSRSLSDKVLALAGVVQAATLVNEIATAGRADELPLQATLGSIIRIEADDVPQIFGGIPGLDYGLRRLTGLLGTAHDPSDVVVLRYTLSLLQLQGKIMDRRALQDVLSSGIQRAQTQMQHFGPSHSNVLAGLADIYVHTAGTVKPRIMITGNPLHLQNQRLVNLVRSVLLGGLRAAVLWRQCGGSRWALLFMRASLQREAQRLLRASGRYV